MDARAQVAAHRHLFAALLLRLQLVIWLATASSLSPRQHANQAALVVLQARCVPAGLGGCRDGVPGISSQQAFRLFTVVHHHTTTPPLPQTFMPSAPSPADAGGGTGVAPAKCRVAEAQGVAHHSSACGYCRGAQPPFHHGEAGQGVRCRAKLWCCVPVAEACSPLAGCKQVATWDLMPVLPAGGSRCVAACGSIVRRTRRAG